MGDAAEKQVRQALTAQERATVQLKERILTGVYPLGALLPTERELSVEIGISRPIIRAALAEISEAGWITREPGHRPRVSLHIAGAAIGRKVNVSGQMDGNAVPVLKTIAAIMPMEPDYPAAYSIVRGIQRTLQRLESSHRLIIFDTILGMNGHPPDAAWSAKEREILETVAREGIAGAILWQSGGQDTVEAIETLRNRHIPIVFVDRHLEDLPCDFVGVDNRAGAREAVSHLITLGHERIAHLTTLGRGNEGSARSVRERYEGYRDALQDHGIPFQPDLVVRSTREAVEFARANMAPPITAVFAVNDASAHAFIDLAAAQGLRVPEDISVAGFDDLDRYTHRSPFLTTMHIPFEMIGERAAERLLYRLESPRSDANTMQHTLLSTRLIVRRSCRAVTKGEEL